MIDEFVFFFKSIGSIISFLFNIPISDNITLGSIILLIIILLIIISFLISNKE